MKYRIFSFLSLFFLFILVVQSTVFASHQFPDVRDSDSFHVGVSYLADNNVIQGYPDGTFQPNRSINRVEALKVLFRGFGITDEALGTPAPSETAGFSDTIAGQWYIKYLLRAKLTLVVQGYPDGTFRPLNQVNLAEALKMLFIVFQVKVPDLKPGVSLPVDVKSTDWFAKYIAYALEKNIISKNSLGKVYPGLGMTRSNFAELVYRMRFMHFNHFNMYSPALYGTAADIGAEEVSGIISRVSINNQNFLLGTMDSGFLTVQISEMTTVTSDLKEGPTSLADLRPGDYVEVTGLINVPSRTFAANLVSVSFVSLQDTDFIYPIAIEQNAFSPSGLEILLNPESTNGVTVRFVNLSDTRHKIASDPHPTHTNLPEFVSGTLEKGQKFEFSFEREGVYTYHDHLNPSLKGTLNISVPQG